MRHKLLLKAAHFYMFSNIFKMGIFKMNFLAFAMFTLQPTLQFKAYNFLLKSAHSQKPTIHPTMLFGYRVFIGQPVCIMASLLSLCHARWAASPSCACFLTRLKGCFWHLAILLATSPAVLMPGRRKKLVTWPSSPCPRPLPPRWQQKVCWSEAMPGTLPAAACDVTTDTLSDETFDWIWGFTFLTSWEMPSQQLTDIQT